MAHKSNWDRIRFRPLSFATAFINEDDIFLGFIKTMEYVRGAVFPSSTIMQEVERNMLFKDRATSSPTWKAFFAYNQAAVAFMPITISTCISPTRR